MKTRLLAPLCALAMLAIVACDDDPNEPVNKTVTFKATLTSASEVPTPPVASTGSGSFTGVLDTSTNMLTYDVAFSGLTSGTSNGHIHGPADAGVTASPILDFKTLPNGTFTLGATSGTAHGTILLTSATQVNATVRGDSLQKLLFAGKTYVNIHTTSNPGGEIRGQVTKQP
jgi:hypothetical protein